MNKIICKQVKTENTENGEERIIIIRRRRNLIWSCKKRKHQEETAAEIISADIFCKSVQIPKETNLRIVFEGREKQRI